MSTDHPFQPGTAVAVKIGGTRWSYEPISWREDEVLKVHKNGNFTLKSDPKQQWRGYAARRLFHGEPMNIASGGMAGAAYGTLHLMADIADKVKEDNEAHARWQRWKAIERLIERLPYERVTDRAISHFEHAIRSLKPMETK